MFIVAFTIYVKLINVMIQILEVMNSKKIILIAVPIAIVVVVALYLGSSSGYFVQSSQNVQASQNTSPQSQTQSGCTKLSDTPYGPYTYLISSDQLSPDAQAALAGFQLNKTALPNGNTTITLTPTGAPSDYKFQSFTLRPGDKLYFLETSFGDDAPQQDVNLRDDTGILVDSSGCIIG